MHRKEQAGLTLLESHLDDFEKAGGERWETLCLMAKGVREYSETVCNETTVREVVGRVLINSLTLVNPTYDPIGICIDPLAATMNHSCNPNAVVSFDGPSLNVRSLRDIGADEEVFISYVDITNNPWRRQKELCERYFFGCDCAECKAGTILQSSAVPSGDEPFLSIESHAVDLLDSAKTSVYAENAVKALEQGMLLVRDSGVCPVFRQPYASLRQQLAVSFVAAQEWISAFAQMLKIYFEIDPILFPQPFHPVRIVHKWTLAKLVLHIAFLSVGEPGSVEKLAPYYLNYATVLWALLMEVEGNVYKSHGPETRFATMVRRKVEQVKVDMTRGDAAIPKLGKAELETQWSALRKVAHDKGLIIAVDLGWRDGAAFIAGYPAEDVTNETQRSESIRKAPEQTAIWHSDLASLLSQN
ncbi:MAG: hypothetical protein M1830_005214 [Pleopsidium flavum]|nr:MAG: hypothetical protein M1830_005214 [Pleopsidium flavum]